MQPYWSLKLPPPPSKVDSSASKPSSPFSLNALSLSRRARFFSSIPSLPTSFGPTMSSRRSLASVRSRFRFRSRSATWYSEAASLASTRSDPEGSEGPSILPLLRPPAFDAPRGSRVWPCVAESTSSRADFKAASSAPEFLDANDHLYPVCFVVESDLGLLYRDSARCVVLSGSTEVKACVELTREFSSVPRLPRLNTEISLYTLAPYLDEFSEVARRSNIKAFERKKDTNTLTSSPCPLRVRQSTANVSKLNVPVVISPMK